MAATGRSNAAGSDRTGSLRPMLMQAPATAAADPGGAGHRIDTAFDVFGGISAMTTDSYSTGSSAMVPPQPLTL